LSNSLVEISGATCGSLPATTTGEREWYEVQCGGGSITGTSIRVTGSSGMSDCLSFAEIVVYAEFSPNKFNVTETTIALGLTGSSIYESLNFPNREIKPTETLPTLSAFGIDGTTGH